MIRRRHAPACFFLVAALAFGCGRPASAAGNDSPSGFGVVLYRPMLADPRESVVHLRVASFTQDYRYGTDPTDSTTTGGWDEDVSGVGFDLGAGKIFRGPAWRSAFGFRPPWRAWQLVASALATTTFDRIGAQLVSASDYQFGGGAEIVWSGDADPGGVRGFRRPVWSTRTALVHRSAHLGDEYVGQSNFGSNRTGPGAGEGLFPHPAVRRMTISHEFIQQLVSFEWAPAGSATLRAYGGGEWTVPIAGPKPAALRSPAGQFGFELRSRGSAASAAHDAVSSGVNRALGFDALSTAWFGAVDVRVARPFNFASCDNPGGETEAWTPSLWTDCPCGREFRKAAASWHAMIGASLFTPCARDVAAGGRLVGGETVLTLDWFQGYSSYDPFLDSRRRSHPRWYVVPSLTMHF